MAQENAVLSAPETQPALAPASTQELTPAPKPQAPRGREPWLTRQARRLVVGRMRKISNGRITIRESGTTRSFGAAGTPASDAGAKALATSTLEGTVEVQDPAFWERLAWGGSIGAAEAFCDGLWSTPDLTAVVRVFARNRTALQEMDSGLGALAAPVRRFVHRLRTNTRSGSIRNISAHYDTGNDFFSTFLDPTLTYSCAIFPGTFATLETAQQWKLDTVCRKLELGPTDHLLEIGTGWGALAIHAARNYGCRVTTTTISKQQFDYASKAIEEAGLGDRITILASDYRDLPAQLTQRFDKLVSIEMIEAVGHRYLPEYFEVIGRMLEPDGLALIQAITIPDQSYDFYRKSVDFIQHYIFPGALLPSMARIQDCVKTRTDLRLLDLEDLTPHYARTLRAWNKRFVKHEAEIAALGLSEAERRMWKYYFGYCEGGFLERTIGDVQILFAKPMNRRDARTGNFA